MDVEIFLGYNFTAMWKYLLICAFFLGMAVFVARQDERAAQKRTQNAKHLDNCTVIAKADTEHPQENVENTERDTPGWYGFFRWPNGTTTWAIILTFLAIVWQSSETRKSADAARDSIKLQELGYTQWVNLQNWRVSNFGPVTSDGVHVNVNFDIINPTKLPLTVTKVTVLPAIGADRSVAIGIPNYLAPGKDYSSGLNVHLPDARVDSSGEIAFTPLGQTSRILVEYEDILTKRFSQEFEVFCAVKSRLDFSFIPSNVPVPKPLPKREQKANRQNPN
jgi:hypothetical protein